MKIKYFIKKEYSQQWESRMNSQVNDVFAFHVTFDKIAFGIVLKMFYERDGLNWYTFTVKLWKTDHIFRLTRKETK